MFARFYIIVLTIIIGTACAVTPTFGATIFDSSKTEYVNTRYPVVAVSLANISDEEVLTVPHLAKQLLEISHSDEQKAFAIFRWITTHISYDFEKLQRGMRRNLNAAEVLEERKAVCGGYAALFQALAQELGLRSFVIKGKAKAYGFNALSHAWNAIQLEGDWYLIDATWGSGYLDEKQRFVRRYNDYYFLPAAEELIFTHYPDEANWQLLDKPISMGEFLDSEQLFPLFLNWALLLR